MSYELIFSDLMCTCVSPLYIKGCFARTVHLKILALYSLRKCRDRVFLALRIIIPVNFTGSLSNEENLAQEHTISPDGYNLGRCVATPSIEP